MSERKSGAQDPHVGPDCMLLYQQEGDEQHRKAAERIHWLEQEVERLRNGLPEFLQLPTPDAIEVFRKSYENHTDSLPFDGRLVPNQWLLNERALSSTFAEEVERLRGRELTQTEWQDRRALEDGDE